MFHITSFNEFLGFIVSVKCLTIFAVEFKKMKIGDKNETENL